MRIKVLNLSGFVSGFLFLIFLCSCFISNLPEIVSNNSNPNFFSCRLLSLTTKILLGEFKNYGLMGFLCNG